MPTYTVQANIKTDRVGALRQLAMIFGHFDPLGVDVTGITFSNAKGTIALTTTQTLTADMAAHLGLV